MDIILEKTTQSFIQDLTSKKHPPIYQLSPEEARTVLEKIQSVPVEKPRVTVEEKTIPVGPKGGVSINIVRPEGIDEMLPIIMYFHGAGWVMGSAFTHERLVYQLAAETRAAVVFVNYSRSPEAKFPLAIEEAYAATEYIFEERSKLNLDPSRLAVAGDSVGGNMAIAVTLLAKERKGPKIQHQVLFYPVTSSELNTPSYQQFSEGPWLTKAAMEWFWNAYEPDVSARKNLLISPLHSSIDQLKGLPPALIITAENDVLRDEGEQFAHKLTQAGVEVTAVRFLGTIHDFVMLNALAKTPPTKEALKLTTSHLLEVFQKQSSKIRKKAA